MQGEFNVLIGAGVLESDKELFFGPLASEDTFVRIDDDPMLSDVLVILGLFSSRSKGRGNGFHREIPEGLSQLRFGKLKTLITILKITGGT